MGERQSVTEIMLFRVRRVGEQSFVTREVILINLLAFGRVDTVRVERARETIQNIKQDEKAHRRASDERNSGKRLEAVPGESQAHEPGASKLFANRPMTVLAAPHLVVWLPA